MRKRLQEMCPHKNVTRDGTNGYVLKETCKDCGKILRHEAEALGPLHQEGVEPPLQQSIPIFDDCRVGHSTNADTGRTEQQSNDKLLARSTRSS